MERSTFIDFISQLFNREGWDARVGGGNQMDVWVGRSATDGIETRAILCHRYADETKVTTTEIEAHADWLASPAVDQVTVLTTSEFTDGARTAADGYQMTCLDGADLLEWIMEADAVDVLEAHLE